MTLIQGNRFLVLGRAGMDLYAQPVNTSIEAAHQYMACLGGSAGNIAASLARLGNQVSMVSCVSDDPVGRFTLQELERYGVSTDYVYTLGGESRTNLAVVDTRGKATQAVIYRNNAVDFELTPEHVESIDYAKHDALIIACAALAKTPSADAVFRAIDFAGQAGLCVILDIDYRPYSWASVNQASHRYLKAVRHADIVIGNDEEFNVMAANQTTGIKLAEELGKSRLVIYKMGQKGAITFSPDKNFETPIFVVKALKPTGAGDAFMGGFCSALAQGFSVNEAVTQGAANAAIVVSKEGCAPAMPNNAELNAFLNKYQT